VLNGKKVRDLIVEPVRSERSVKSCRVLLHSNGWFGEIRCTARRSPLHSRRNAASAKLGNPMSVLSALPTSANGDANGGFAEQRTLVQNAANEGNEPNVSPK
jgi:hypothetical protein